MLEDYKNGCCKPSTLEVYDKLSKLNHVWSLGMYVDEEGEEVVGFSFTHYQDTFHGTVTPESGVAELIMEYDMMMDGGEKERISDFYGYVELDKLIELLNKIPHINSIMIDMKVGERVH